MRPAHSAPKAHRWGRRRPTFGGVVAAVCVAVACLAGGIVMYGGYQASQVPVPGEAAAVTTGTTGAQLAKAGWVPIRLEPVESALGPLAYTLSDGTSMRKGWGLIAAYHDRYGDFGEVKQPDLLLRAWINTTPSGDPDATIFTRPATPLSDPLQFDKGAQQDRAIVLLKVTKARNTGIYAGYVAPADTPISKLADLTREQLPPLIDVPGSPISIDDQPFRAHGWVAWNTIPQG